MFIRKLKNRSGSISVQIISKESQKYKVVKTIGSSKTEEGINLLLYQAKHELDKATKNIYLNCLKAVAKADGQITNDETDLYNAISNIVLGK